MMQQKVLLTNPYENCGLRKKNDDFCEYSAAAPSQCWICFLLQSLVVLMPVCGAHNETLKNIIAKEENRERK